MGVSIDKVPGQRGKGMCCPVLRRRGRWDKIFLTEKPQGFTVAENTQVAYVIATASCT
jgi:hypothetical protein